MMAIVLIKIKPKNGGYFECGMKNAGWGMK